MPSASLPPNLENCRISKTVVSPLSTGKVFSIAIIVENREMLYIISTISSLSGLWKFWRYAMSYYLTFLCVCYFFI